jgi:hypothetical protein
MNLYFLQLNAYLLKAQNSKKGSAGKPPEPPVKPKFISLKNKNSVFLSKHLIIKPNV